MLYDSLVGKIKSLVATHSVSNGWEEAVRYPSYLNFMKISKIWNDIALHVPCLKE